MELEFHNNTAKKNVVNMSEAALNASDLGEYILKNLNLEDKEKILKRVAMDKLLSQVLKKEDNVIPIPTRSPEEDKKQLKDEMLYYLALCQFKGLGSSHIKRLHKQFNSLEDIFKAPIDYLKSKGLPQVLVSNLSEDSARERALDKAYNILHICNTENINLMYCSNRHFPDSILHDETMPSLIFYKGDISFLKRSRNVALYGKKDASEFGVRAVNSLSSSLASEGYTITSNAYSTVGTQSSFISIQHNSPPLVVFPTSIDHATTKLKRKFINYVLDGGGLVTSIFYPGEKYTYRNIIQSNKFQLMLSQAMVLIESDPTLATSQLVMSAKTHRKPIVVPIPPKQFRGINKDVVNLLQNDPSILSIRSRDEYYKIFQLLRKIEANNLNKLNSNPSEQIF